MVLRKLATELVIGDTVIEIDSIHLPPTLVESDGKLTIHTSRVVGLERGHETPEVFDPIIHRQEGFNQAGINALPNAGKAFPVITVALAGYEDDERLDQGEAFYEVRAFSVVEVIDGDLSALKENL